MNLGVQYYRAPFPLSKYWEADINRLAESGFNTMQIWLSWGWIESREGRFDFSDYDRLIELAERKKLRLVLSTIAEIQPNWIHRALPDSYMIDNRGNKVISCGRDEHHFGLTPGGCFDHPQLLRKMSEFIRQCGLHYRSLDSLVGWDIWNELRWNVHADAPVCYCEHTLRQFRDFLARRFGSLEGLNQAWLRRYSSWDDVCPGKTHGRLYTEMMAFEHFLTCRANTHAAMRYQVMREVDREHLITAHGGQPSALYAGNEEIFAIDRGNDWVLSEELDGIGCSSFPCWSGIDDADFGMRIDMVKSAANGKKVWLSELQGGRSAIGFEVFANVEAAQQQRWLFNGLACGADTVLFWCYRDEVFGRETGGFGIAGDDGLAAERLQSMAFAGSLIRQYETVFDAYRPASCAVGVFFSPQSYYLNWAQDGNARRMRDSLMGYERALTKQSIPFVSVEEEHLDILDQLAIVFLPQVVVTSPPVEAALTRFVERGGIMVVESECGAFAPNGIYRYASERFLAAMGVVEIGRRNLDAGDPSGVFEYGNRQYRLGLCQWTTPLKAMEGKKTGLLTEVGYGKGKIIHLASYPGWMYRKQYCHDFELLLNVIVKTAGIRLTVAVVTPEPGEKDFVYVKHGRSNGLDLLFVFFPPQVETATLLLSDDIFASGQVIELFSGQRNKLGGRENGERRFTVSKGWQNMSIYLMEKTE